jgi:inorganic phosphate transporter, PiT family
MATATATRAAAPKTAHSVHDKMSKGPGAVGMLIFGVVLIIGIVYIGYSLSHDLIGLKTGSVLPYVLLGVALFVALRWPLNS